MVPSSEMYYLMPVFKEVSPFVEVNGKLWAQPGLFSEISWNDIEAVCPNPTGLCTGDLNGIDLNGWTWASVDDVTALFNYYIGSDVLGPAPVSYFEYDSEWAPAFFSDGWARTNMHESSRLKVVEGWLRSLHDDQNAYHAQILYITGPAFDTVDSRNADHVRIVEDEIAHIFDDRGAWFYRTP